MLDLDQYVIVNIMPVLDDIILVHSAKGVDKNGAECDVPVDHIIHDKLFENVTLYYAGQQFRVI
jgi:hypothetical protein